MNYSASSPSPPQSPSSSVVMPDTTTHAERALTDAAFARRAEEALQLHVPRDRAHARDAILLPQPNSPAEERRMHEQAMARLRQHVAQLEDETLFDAVAELQQPGLEPRPTSNNIGAILASAMNTTAPPRNAHAPRKSATPSRSVSATHTSIPASARTSVPRQIR